MSKNKRVLALAVALVTADPGASAAAVEDLESHERVLTTISSDDTNVFGRLAGYEVKSDVNDECAAIQAIVNLLGDSHTVIVLDYEYFQPIADLALKHKLLSYEEVQGITIISIMEKLSWSSSFQGDMYAYAKQFDIDDQFENGLLRDVQLLMAVNDHLDRMASGTAEAA